MTEETKMLNVAAAERTMLRAALRDCVLILEEIKLRDETSPSGRSIRWKRDNPWGVALNHARQILEPRPDLKTQPKKETCAA